MSPRTISTVDIKNIKSLAYPSLGRRWVNNGNGSSDKSAILQISFLYPGELSLEAFNHTFA